MTLPRIIFKEMTLKENIDVIKWAYFENNGALSVHDFTVKYFPQLANLDSNLSKDEIYKVIEDLVGTFNSIKMGFPSGMTEERYKYFIEELSNGFNDIVKAVPLLKTNDQVRKEQEEKYLMFYNDDSKTINSAEQASDFEAFDWETQTDQHKHRQ